MHSQPTGEAVFEVLIREHEFALTAFVRASGLDAASADDVIQETIIAAWQDLAAYDRRLPFAGWLRGIAHHKILDHYRSAAGRRTRPLEPYQLDAISTEFSRLIPGRGDSVNDTFAALHDCLSALAPDDHDIVRRAYHTQQTCNQIAAALDRTIEAVKKRLQRARAQLRDCILGKLHAESANG